MNKETNMEADVSNSKTGTAIGDLTGVEVKISRPSKSEVIIEGKVADAVTSSRRPEVMRGVLENMELPGFRKGQVPEAVAAKKFGEFEIFEMMVGKTIESIVPAILAANNISPIGNPAVTVTKMAPGNEVEFIIKVAVMPDIVLPDYKAIASGINKEPIEEQAATDEEVESAVSEIIRSRKNETPGTSELTDDFVKTLGQFKDVADFKSKLKEMIRGEKIRNAKEKRRLSIIDRISGKTSLDIPNVLIENECDRMLQELQQNLERMGTKMNDYLALINKSEAEC